VCCAGQGRLPITQLPQNSQNSPRLPQKSFICLKTMKNPSLFSRRAAGFTTLSRNGEVIYISDSEGLSKPRTGGTSRRQGLRIRQSSCDDGYTPCDDFCMDVINTCCNDGNGYCDQGYYCTASACCVNGGSCEDLDQCPQDQVTCGRDWCIPVGAQCCDPVNGLYESHPDIHVLTSLR
jgi:hypothetical protein